MPMSEISRPKLIGGLADFSRCLFATDQPLEGLREQNVLVDKIYYDTSVITHEEQQLLEACKAGEGVMLLVFPSNSTGLEIVRSLDQLAEVGGDGVAAIAVAGVGSSALGSGAFARNIADACQGPVLAIVSGYGLWDLAFEATGGFFFYGAINQMRNYYESMDRWWGDPDADRFSQYFTAISPVGLSDDTRRLFQLLLDSRFSFRYLIGHSKGNLVISEALYALKNHHKERLDALSKQCRIITLGAKIRMPDGFRVTDILGNYDLLGRLNSRLDIGTDIALPGKGHSTNPDVGPLGIDVTELLGELLTS